MYWGVVVDEPRVVIEDEGHAVQVQGVLLILFVSGAVLVDPESGPVEPFAFEPVFGPFGVAGEDRRAPGTLSRLTSMVNADSGIVAASSNRAPASVKPWILVWAWASLKPTTRHSRPKIVHVPVDCR